MTEVTSSPIIAYCHIGKVGGKQFQFYLRSHFGHSYRCVARSRDYLYSGSELKSDLRWNPLLKYVGGHDVRPFVDYGVAGKRLKWFSIFREPLARMVSHYYQQTVFKNYRVKSILDWLVKNPNRGHWQIYMIAGENNLSKAKDIILKKFSLIGLNEHYEESLLLFADHFGLKNFRFLHTRSLPELDKPARFNAVMEEFKANQDAIREIMHEEIQFYEFIRGIYEAQCQDYGRHRLSENLDSVLKTDVSLPRYNVNNVVANCFDHLFWRPRVRLLSSIGFSSNQIPLETYQSEDGS